MSLIQRTISYLQERRDKIIGGGINSISSPFVRFSNDFIGIEQAKYYCVTASTKVGKTQLMSYLFLYTPLLYAYHHKDKIKLTVFYYPLEETPQDITERFMSFLLFKLSKGKVRISPTDLKSTKNDRPVSQEVLDLLNSEEYTKVLNFFEETVHFSESRNPTGVYNEVRKYMEDNGTVETRKQKVKDDFGSTKEVDAFDHYIPNNSNEYVIVVVDHASLCSVERGMSLKQTIDKLSEYFVLLRNRYGVTPVLVQQQAFENESLDAYKERRLRPTPQGLADSKYPARDCNVMLGLFSPFKFELPNYYGYDIQRFKDNIRFLEVCINRGGNAGGIIGLFFDGATCNFYELPSPNDDSKIAKVYEYLDSIRGRAKRNTSFLAYCKIIKKHLFK